MEETPKMKFQGTISFARFSPSELKNIVWASDSGSTMQCFFNEDKILDAEEQDALEEILFHYSGGEAIPTQPLAGEERIKYLEILVKAGMA